MKIGLLSDTHGHLDPQIPGYFRDVDEIWHAGDIGDMDVLDQLQALKPTVAVYGNIDDQTIRSILPEDQVFQRCGLHIWMTHIGGYPPEYTPRIRSKIDSIKPGLFICGHSHILKIMPDRDRRPLLHINPGAAGRQGLHKYRTIVRFEVAEATIRNPEVVRLGKRGATT